jgi:hypothetical protein
MDCFLFTENIPERTFHSNEDTVLIRITHRYLEKILQMLYSLELGDCVVPMRMYPVPDKCLTGTMNNPG